jgi:hypothetical protein
VNNGILAWGGMMREFDLNIERVLENWTAFSTYPARLWYICQRSATWIAAGAPLRAPSAYAPARSRQITSVPGWARSQFSNVPASRSGSMSTGLPVPTSTSTFAVVPAAAEREIVQSEHPHRLGLGIGKCHDQSQHAGPPGGKAQHGSQPRPGPAGQRQRDPGSAPRSTGVRRARREVRPSICSANVTAGQTGLLQKNRRTVSRISTRCPATGASASRRP